MSSHAHPKRLLVAAYLPQPAQEAPAATGQVVVDATGGRRVAGERHTGRRTFWPHITVARFSRPTHVRKSPSRQSEHVFDIDRIPLYDSHTTTGGPPRDERSLGIPLDGSLAERKISNG